MKALDIVEVTRMRHEPVHRATILDQIEQLPEADRLLLDQRLAERVEAEWMREAEEARRLALERGVDQAAIDQAVQDFRYGK